MKKKGQYEELLKEKEDLITSLTEKANLYDEYLTQKQKDTETKLNSLMKTIPKEVLEENSYILEDLKEDNTAQIEIQCFKEAEPFIHVLGKKIKLFTCLKSNKPYECECEIIKNCF